MLDREPQSPSSVQTRHWADGFPLQGMIANIMIILSSNPATL